MAYFNELPNIAYLSRLPSKKRSNERIDVKNIFKRARLRDDIDAAATAFTYYQIKEGERPDTLAQRVYEDPELDWVILISNNITNIRDQWPLNHYDLHQYMLDKYGSEAGMQGVHHYETTEVKDNFGRTVLKKGLTVDTGFTIKYKDSTNTILTVTPTAPVSNYQYETEVNEEKRKIKILKADYLSVFVTDMRNLMLYDKSSDYIDKITKSTYNPNESGV